MTRTTVNGTPIREVLGQGMYDMQDVRSVNSRAGQHWFSPDTMRFFRSRVGDTLYGGRYFVSSERFELYYPEYRSEPRRYTVREVNDAGGIDTVGEFQEHETRAQAIAAIRRLLTS